jgi:hypothetical protein
VSVVAAEMPAASDQTEVVRWYTHARRFPILIGKAGMNGDPLPGGPYTSTQVVGWFGTLALLYLTRDMWGVFGGFTNGLLLLGIPILVGWAARWIPHDARNPVLVAAGWVRCFGAPAAGRVDGVPVRLRGEQRLRHQFVVDPRSFAGDPAVEPVGQPAVASRSVEPAVASRSVEPAGLVPHPAASPVHRRSRDATAGPPAAPAVAGLSGVQALLAGPVAAPADAGPVEVDAGVGIFNDGVGSSHDTWWR